MAQQMRSTDELNQINTELNEKAAKNAKQVQVITLAGLIYVPITFVAVSLCLLLLSTSAGHRSDILKQSFLDAGLITSSNTLNLGLFKIFGIMSLIMIFITLAIYVGWRVVGKWKNLAKVEFDIEAQEEKRK